MGCDVHMFVEKRNPSNGRWEKVGAEFLDSWTLSHILKSLETIFGLTIEESRNIALKYYKKKSPSNKVEEKIFDFINKNTTTDENFFWWKDEYSTKLPLPYTDTPYTDRNYTLFGALAGVRDSSVKLIADMERGLPDDVSEEVCEISDAFGIDGHSHNYLYLYEILSSDYYGMSDQDLNEFGFGTYFFRDVVEALLEIGDPKDVRLVFWFDN